MSDQKENLTRTEVGRIVDAEVREEIAKLTQQRPSLAMRAADAGSAAIDITAKYPLASWAMGTIIFVGSLAFLEGVKLYIGVVVGVAFVPGLARKVVNLAAGLARAKANGNGGK